VGLLVIAHEFAIWNESQAVAIVIEDLEKINKIARIVLWILNNAIVFAQLLLSVQVQYFDAYCGGLLKNNIFIYLFI